MLIAPAQAIAHSSLLEATPAIDSTVEAAPSEIVLRFSDSVTVPDGVVSILDLAGRELADSEVQVDDTTVTIPVDDEGGSGTRVVAWQVISDHGSVVKGSYTYNVGAVTPGSDSGAGAVEGDVVERELLGLFRALSGTGLAFGALLTIMWAVRARRGRDVERARAVLMGCAVVVALAGVTGFAVAGTARGLVGAWLLAGAGVAIVVVVLTVLKARRTLVLVAAAAAMVAVLMGVASSAPSEPEPVLVVQEVSLGDGASAIVTLDPAVAGRTSLIVDVKATDGSPDTDAAEVNVRYKPEGDRFGHFKRELRRDGAGRFAADKLPLPFAGKWEFEVTVSEDKFSAALATFRARVQANPEIDQ